MNDVVPNSMALHTGSACTMPAGADCDVYTDGNAGCTAHAPDADSYGPGLNAGGGG